MRDIYAQDLGHEKIYFLYNLQVKFGPMSKTAILESRNVIEVIKLNCFSLPNLKC